MAKRTIHMLIDDIDGTEADETVQFTVDGIQYEIDLTKGNAEKLREAFAPYTQVGMKLGRKGRPPEHRAATYRRTELATSGRTRKEQLRTIREWAQHVGIAVSERGRVREEIVDAYEARDTPQAADTLDRAHRASGSMPPQAAPPAPVAPAPAPAFVAPQPAASAPPRQRARAKATAGKK